MSRHSLHVLIQLMLAVPMLLVASSAAAATGQATSAFYLIDLVP